MNRLDALTTRIKEIKEDYTIPGLAVGIAQGNTILYEQYLGVTSINSNALITANTPFCVASISKTPVAMAILYLCDQSKIQLTDFAYSIVPEFTMDDPMYQHITIEMLLSHRSGLPDVSMTEYLKLLDYPDMSFMDYVTMMQDKSLHTPGDRFEYSNYGYAILGEVIHHVTGKPFVDYMDEFMSHLGLQHTSFTNPNGNNIVSHPHLRVPLLHVANPTPYSSVDAPASFMHTTVRDMLHFYPSLTSLLSKQTIETMKQARSKRHYPPFYQGSGLGWNIGSFQDELVISHGGMGFGSTGFYMVFPHLNISAIIMCNEESYAHEQIYHAVANTIVNVPFQPYKPSWLTPIANAYLTISQEDIVLLMDKLELDENIQSDPDELVAVAYQMIVANKWEDLHNYLRLLQQRYPTHQEINSLLEEFRKK